MSVIRSSKPGGTSVNLLHNVTTLSDSHSKAKTSYLTEATVSETRPGGDVILSTPQGLIRANSSIFLEEGDKVSVRLTKDDEGDVIAHIISRTDNSTITNKVDKFGIELLNKYIIQTLKSDIQNSSDASSFPATVSYVAANRRTLLYGNIHPGDNVTIQMVSTKTINHGTAHGLDVISGEVLSNSHNSVIINSPIAMFNLNAKSNLSVGDRVLFRVVGAADQLEQAVIKELIANALNKISENELQLKSLLEAMSNLDDDDNYTRLLHLIASSDNRNITLARLFHDTRHVASNDVERWIDEEIVEPFEASSSKSSIFHSLAKDLEEIAEHFINLRLMPENNRWQLLEVPIPGTKEQAKMRVKREKKDLVEFIIDIEHASFGKMLLQGSLTLPEANNFPILNMNIKCTNSLPEALRDTILTSFATHKAMSAIDGEIVFE